MGNARHKREGKGKKKTEKEKGMQKIGRVQKEGVTSPFGFSTFSLDRARKTVERVKKSARKRQHHIRIHM